MRRTLQHTTLPSHPFTGLDARIKLLTALALLIMVISYRGMAFPLLLAGLGVIICLTLRVRPRLLLLRFAEPLLLALLVLLLKAFFSGQTMLWSVTLFGLEIVCHADGLQEGFQIASRIMGAVSVVAAAGFATPFTEVMGALAWMRLPRGLIEVMVFAWRYLFLLLDDAQVIHAAQKNRLGYTGFRRGFRSFGTLTGALVIKAFDSSQTMTVAMVQRGYDGTLPLFRHKPFRVGQLLGALSMVSLFGLIWQL